MFVNMSWIVDIFICLFKCGIEVIATKRPESSILYVSEGGYNNVRDKMLHVGFLSANDRQACIIPLHTCIY